ncbi:MAG TPA: HepT-like ribonuclease domain-containing protein [Euzebya sp.]|nr:HepT-like ribonuclease domain-containing protein [Euzebya sp.]
MVDPDRARRLLGILDRYLRLLREGTEDAFRRRYLVQTTAQVCIDLAGHVVASEGYRTPADYADTFTVLAEEEVIGEDLAARLRRMAGMRNLIVHLYADVDDDRVADEIAGGQDDLEAFARTIASLVADRAP